LDRLPSESDIARRLGRVVLVAVVVAAFALIILAVTHR
jgi:hypothetical protein